MRIFIGIDIDIQDFKGLSEVIPLALIITAFAN